MNEAILAIDCGTSGIKSTLLMKNGNEPGVTILPANKTQVPTTTGTSLLVREWEPASFIRHVSEHIFEEVIRAEKEGAQIVGIAPTTTTSSLLAIEDNKISSLLKPLRWDDRQAQEDASLLEEIRKSTKAFEWINPISADSGIAKAVFLMRTHHSELQDKNLQLLEQWSFLNWFLTRKIVQSESILSRKWGFSRSVPWKKEFLNRVVKKLQPYLDVMFPQNSNSLVWLKEKIIPGSITGAGDEIGTICYRAADAFGLPCNVRVFSVPYDACAQVIGLGLLNSTDNICVALGTSLGVTASVKKDRKLKMSPAGPIPDTPIHGTQMLFDGFASCGSAIEYLCKQHNILDAFGEPDIQFVDHAIGRIPPGAKGYKILPFFNGGRRSSSADPSQVGGYSSGDRVGIGKNEYVKGLFESFGYLIRTVIEDFQTISKAPFKTILAGGGPAKSQQFMQLLADITNREVRVSEYPDSSLVGCGICAAAGLNWFNSLEEASRKMVQSGARFTPQSGNRDAYEQLYQEYLQEYEKQISRIN